MRTLALIALSLAACQTSAPPNETALDVQLRDRARDFAVAMESRDTASGLAFAAESARGFFEAEVEFEQLQWGEHEPRAPAAVAVKSTNIDGNHGIAVVTMTRDGESQDLGLHFELKNHVWGVVGFQLDGDNEAKLFADREAKVRERIARAKEETTPHSEFGPLVVAYLAAAAKLDRVGMMANMSADCQLAQASENSFTAGFLAKRFQVKRWQFSRYEEEGDSGKQHIRTMLRLANGEVDSEPMRFGFAKTSAGWVISELR